MAKRKNVVQEGFSLHEQVDKLRDRAFDEGRTQVGEIYRQVGRTLLRLREHDRAEVPD